MNKKEYRYRKHIRWGQYFIAGFFGCLIVACWLLILFSFLAQGGVHPSDLSKACIITGVFGFEGWLLWLFYHRLAGMRFLIEENQVIYKTRKEDITVPFDDIQKLQFPSLKYLGGWVKIVSQKKDIRLTVVVEDIGSLIQELKAALDQRGLSDRYDQKKIFLFLKTATYTDQSWARIYRIFWSLSAFMVVSGVIGLICAKLANLNSAGVFWWVFFAATWPTDVYLLTEFLFMRKVGKESDEDAFTCPPVNRSYGKSVYRNATFAGIAIYVAVSIIAFFVVRNNVG